MSDKIVGILGGRTCRFQNILIKVLTFLPQIVNSILLDFTILNLCRWRPIGPHVSGLRVAFEYKGCYP